MTRSIRLKPKDLKTFSQALRQKSSITKNDLKEKSKIGKYKSQYTYIDDICFPSKAQANFYLHLKDLQKYAIIKFFLCETPIHLPGGVKYVCDFLVFNQDNTYDFIDVKGYETQLFKTKKKIVESIYPIEIKIIRKNIEFTSLISSAQSFKKAANV